MAAEKIQFTDITTGETDESYVLETTTLNQIEYLLVTFDEQGDSDALILKKTPGEGEAEDAYVIVEDDQELDVIAKIFMEILEDVDIE